ncbi:MAG: T9SS type A sorting domain-containing protein [Calditrichaeota bacterium]|nr:T9SS type A sorting domain-containing protein [Calditrichota bacterium]
MYINSLKYFLFFFVVNNLLGQVISIPTLQRDDFKVHKSWWMLNSTDPYQADPVINNGYILITTSNPFPYGGDNLHNVGFESASLDRIYFEEDTVFLKVRVRFLNDHFPGSRGFGWWYKESMTLNTSEQSWFLQQKEEDGHSWTANETYWRADQSNGKKYSTHDSVDLSTDYLTGWHVYEINRYGTNRIEYFVDDSLVMTSTTALPDKGYDYHQWIDNWVYHETPAGGDDYDITIYPRFWAGDNQQICDYVQITFGSEPTSYVETPTGILKLRAYPNEIGPAGTDSLWKTYSFNSDGGRSLILITAQAEDYNGYDTADEMRVVVGGHNYGYGGLKSLDGAVLQSAEKTVIIDTLMSAGMRDIQIYSTTTPILYDVNVLNSANGAILINQEINETAPVASNDYLWKTIDFSLTNNGEVGIYITAAADENSGWAYRGPDNGDPNVDDASDDDLRIELNATNYGWQTDKAWHGNREFGEIKTVLLHETLTAGNHQLRLYANNTPTLYRVIIFGENEDMSLPVELSAFDVYAEGNKNVIQWQTQSELENMGFNLYRSIVETNVKQGRDQFIKINKEMIKGAGTTAYSSHYKYEDVSSGIIGSYWYKLESISFAGESELFDAKKVENRLTDFQLKQNYPNPFNAHTTIRYNVQEEGLINLELYDQRGGFVKSLFSNIQAKGWHSYLLNAKGLASGIYYYKISSQKESSIQIRKMILLK